MTAEPLSARERAIVDRFEAAEYPSEVAEVRLRRLEIAPPDIYLCACGDPDNCRQVRP